ASLLPLMKLVVAYYVSVIVFIVVILWTVLRWCGVGLVEFLRYIKEEIIIVFGTITSEAVMPRLISKLEDLGCKPDVVRIVLPTAYSFNLDGTALYLVLAPLFIAQALNLDLSWTDKRSLFLLLVLTSKGAAGGTGGVLVTLVSTMIAHPVIPAAGLAITLGVDRFLNEGRAVVNLIGNAVATLAIARWDRSLDTARMHAVLQGRVADRSQEILAEPNPENVVFRDSPISPGPRSPRPGPPSHFLLHLLDHYLIFDNCPTGTGLAGVADKASSPIGRTQYQPLYAQVKALLLKRIGSGSWKPGEMLPNENDLAAEYNVSQG